MHNISQISRQTRISLPSYSNAPPSSSRKSSPKYIVKKEYLIPKPSMYTALKKSAKKSKSRDYSQEHIPRPCNAFILFRSNFNRQGIWAKSSGDPSTKNPEILTWRSMTAEQRKPWFDMAIEEKALHRIKYPNYKFRPVHDKPKGVTKKKFKKHTSASSNANKKPIKPEASPIHDEDSVASTSGGSRSIPLPSYSRVGSPVDLTWIPQEEFVKQKYLDASSDDRCNLLSMSSTDNEARTSDYSSLCLDRQALGTDSDHVPKQEYFENEFQLEVSRHDDEYDTFQASSSNNEAYTFDSSPIYANQQGINPGSSSERSVEQSLLWREFVEPSGTNRYDFSSISHPNCEVHPYNHDATFQFSQETGYGISHFYLSPFEALLPEPQFD